MSLVDIHARLANTALLYGVLLGVWGLWRFFRKQGVDSSYWGALAIAELLIAIQAGLGVVLWLNGARPDRTIHILYGVVSLLAIPTAFALTKGRDKRSDMLVYGAVLLFLCGLILRAVSTG
ncbi:MAG: hypothetical protein EHM70_12745 [Chloroflexota bacterium]|nr:MAG: hypothetical protein EHM70_12745 [Chloroflexota bacterium]